MVHKDDRLVSAPDKKKEGLFIMEGLKRLRGYALFGILYMMSFSFVEGRNVKYHIIHSQIDEVIPFCEYFVIPYLLWFAYVTVTVLYFAFFVKEKKEFTQLMWSFCVGMALFIVISLVFPNGQRLRPRLYAQDGFFIELIKMVYRKDTPTNIFPSIHVYNSVVCCIAILRNKTCAKHLWVTIGTTVLTVLIIASTVFIKQHSIIDMIGALLLNAIVAVAIYRPRSAYVAKTKRVVG